MLKFIGILSIFAFALVAGDVPLEKIGTLELAQKQTSAQQKKEGQHRIQHSRLAIKKNNAFNWRDSFRNLPENDKKQDTSGEPGDAVSGINSNGSSAKENSKSNNVNSNTSGGTSGYNTNSNTANSNSNGEPTGHYTNSNSEHNNGEDSGHYTSSNSANSNNNGEPTGHNTNSNSEHSNSNGDANGYSNNNGGSGESDTTAYNSLGETTNSAYEVSANGSKKNIFFILMFGIAGVLIGSSICWVQMVSVRKRKNNNRDGDNSDQTTVLFEKMSNTYDAIERIAISSYNDVKSRLSGFSFYMATRSTKLSRHQSSFQTNNESSDENSAVSSLSGGSYERVDEKPLQSAFRLAPGGLSCNSSNTDLDSLSICIRNAKEENCKLPGIAKDQDTDLSHHNSQPLFIHYVPV